MSRGATARRRRSDTEARLAVCGRVDSEGNGDDAEGAELICRDERLRDENAGLRERVAELEGWYRLLQEDHNGLQDENRRISRRGTELQTEVNRLEVENAERGALIMRLGVAGYEPRVHQEKSTMIRFAKLSQAARRHTWVAAAVVAIATLLARDTAVRGVFAEAVARVRQATSSRDETPREVADSGYLRYAAMVRSLERLERARAEYNKGEATLKGDALLEAQDRLRAAKAQYREARHAFLPELARQCEQARVGLPREAAEALASLNDESNH
jgi:hypothetical protein